MPSVLLKGPYKKKEEFIYHKYTYKKLYVKNAIQYSNEKCLISVTRGP